MLSKFEQLVLCHRNMRTQFQVRSQFTYAVTYIICSHIRGQFTVVPQRDRYIIGSAWNSQTLWCQNLQPGAMQETKSREILPLVVERAVLWRLDQRQIMCAGNRTLQMNPWKWGVKKMNAPSIFQRCGSKESQKREFKFLVVSTYANNVVIPQSKPLIAAKDLAKNMTADFGSLQKVVLCYMRILTFCSGKF